MKHASAYKAVISSTWYSCKSLLAPWRGTARRWQLMLACGHVEERPFRYRDEPAAGGSTYAFEQALPPPRRCVCHRCAALAQ